MIIDSYISTIILYIPSSDIVLTKTIFVIDACDSLYKGKQS